MPGTEYSGLARAILGGAFSCGSIDAMKRVEDAMAVDIGRLCRDKFTAVAMLVIDVDPAANQLGVEGGIGLYAVGGAMPKPTRSILDVLRARSRHLEQMRGQLSETDAYAMLRAAAMNQSKCIVDVAAALGSMAEMLNP